MGLFASARLTCRENHRVLGSVRQDEWLCMPIVRTRRRGCHQ